MEISAELRAAAWRELNAPTMAFDICPGPDSVGREVGGNKRALSWIIDGTPSQLAMDNERFVMARDNNMPPRGGYRNQMLTGEDGTFYPNGGSNQQRPRKPAPSFSSARPSLPRSWTGSMPHGRPCAHS